MPSESAVRRLRRAAVATTLAAMAFWAGSTLIENRRHAWAHEAAELQALAVPAHFAATPGEIFGGLR